MQNIAKIYNENLYRRKSIITTRKINVKSCKKPWEGKKSISRVTLATPNYELFKRELLSV